MASDDDKKPALRGRSMSVAAETIREEVRFMVRRIPTLVAPEETSRKGQFNIIARMTGYPPRRVKDLWHGTVNKIPAHQERTIRHVYVDALQRWKTSALAQLEHVEAESARLQRDAAGYASERWARATATGFGASYVGKKPTDSTETD